MRELLITIYLIVFKITFTLCKLFPVKDKTTFVTAFGDNIYYTLEALEKETNQKRIVIHSNLCKHDLAKQSDRVIICYRTANPLQWIKAVYHIATAKTLFIDTYFAFLSVSNFKSEVRCVQLWHAVGAMKKFGLEDHSIKSRSLHAQKRFREVYKRFDYIVIGSEKMLLIFKKAFGVTESQLLRTGIPRTDFFFKDKEKKLAMEQLKEELAFDDSKKILLYAPTYRDNQLKVQDLPLDLDKLYQELKNDYILFLSLHPAVKGTLSNQYQDFIYDVSKYHINHVSLITDILITDYSSIPFEFSILHRPIIFFPYDLEEYENTRGLWDKYEHLVPGPIAKDTYEIIDIIKANGFNKEEIVQFGKLWNQYSKGNSSKNLIKMLYGNN